MMKLGDSGINPTTFEREATCQHHGAYTERGGSFSGRQDRVIWFGCQECAKIQRELQEIEDKATEERKKQERIEARLSVAGIPAGFRGRTFQNYRAETPEMASALNISREFAENFYSSHLKSGTFLVFGGQPGTGKSHLALAIAQQVISRSTVMYLDVMDVFRKVRSTWSKESKDTEDDVLRLLGSLVDLLIIDEVGSQRGTDDEQMILFDVINRRYRDLRPTILLTNLMGKTLTDYLGPRITDRMKERAIFVPFKWESYRSRKTD